MILPKKIILASPRGFCAGVDRAIEIVNIALNLYDLPIYVRHEIVHNHHVVNDFINRGVIFVEDISEVPPNSVLILSAHGTDPQVIAEAEARKNLTILDAVCPLVTKVHREIAKAMQENKLVVYIGHKGHQEVVGALGHAQREKIFLIEEVQDIDKHASKLTDQELVLCTQTTLSLNDTSKIITALKERFPQISLPKADDICYATQNRQDAVAELSKLCDLILIIGSRNSSNTLRLVELAKELSTPVELVSDPDKFNLIQLHHKKIIGISSGASAPELLVDQLIGKLLENYRESVADLKSMKILEDLTLKDENISFRLPEMPVHN
jgi:4-hydroxy-3-methylbut-2-enyl diphosphate reductase